MIIYSGRIMKEKGVEQLIKAYLTIVRKYHNAKLMIIGDGPDYEVIRKKYADYQGIIFTGKMPFEDVIIKLTLGGIYCFPTMYPEGLPTCVLEAMAVGLYTITSAKGGAKEVIIDDRYGRIMSDCSVETIVEEFERAFSMTINERNRIASDGQLRVKNSFTWQSTVDELEKIMIGYGD